MYAKVTKRILNGEPVEYMKREIPKSFQDSGWLFIAKGDTVNDLKDTHDCDLDVIKKKNPEIHKYLSNNEGSAFIRFGKSYIPIPQKGGFM